MVVIAGAAASLVFVGCGGSSATIDRDDFERPGVALSEITLGPTVALAPIDHDREVELVVGQPVWVQPDGDGWRFVDSRLVEICDPIIERTTLYEMAADGQFEEVRFVDESEDGVCI